MLKHRIVLTLIYSAGLRGQEVINLKISDIDFERKTIHIRQSKYKKDRIVPLSNVMADGLRKYIDMEHPHPWLFNGKEPDRRYSVRGLSWVMREALKKTSIKKDVNLHSLRHTYATHLLEEGLDMVTLKYLLERVLPVKHYHIVFTLPHELNCISLLNNKWFYNRLLFADGIVLPCFIKKSQEICYLARR